ncbi:MAG TPA: hypothetical protein VH143_35270 [Kofleriaceae bacterium]|nr:hypothetical protein [Kofleriaceae bacterium]
MQARFIIAVIVVASTAYADKLGALVMDGHDAAHIMYADRCSNGGNADRPGFDRFVAALRADPKSKLSIALVDTETKYVSDKFLYEVALGDWIQTYHLRDGCADNSNSFSAFIYVRAKVSNSNELWTRYVVTIDDDVASDRRTLHFRSVLPLSLREN